MTAKSAILHEQIDAVFNNVGQKLREGRSGEAEKILTKAIEGSNHSSDDLANLKRLLSFTYETAGKYKESLEVIKSFADDKNLQSLSLETQLKVKVQLAIAFNNLGDQPKAVTLLKATLQKAEDGAIRHLYGRIHVSLARVYRWLNEYPIARGYAERSLEFFRGDGDWLGMAEAYREIANSLHHEGDSEKAIEMFDLGIKIIGDNSVPFMLGRLYTDMSGAYWFLRKPHDGIACLKKSIAFFNQTEHILNSMIAYNNMGIHLVRIGEWAAAEEMINRALGIATSHDHPHLAGIFDSLGELRILQGRLEEAQDLLEKAVAFTKRKKRHWYEVQSMQNLARCYLAQERFDRAIELVGETVKRSREIGDKHYANMAGLVLAESMLGLGRPTEADAALESVEANDPNSDFFVLGNIQRIRGLAALEEGDRELAVHHFNRSLTIFEAAEDLYHTALLHYLIGENLEHDKADRAIRNLTTAAEIFRKLGIEPLSKSAAERIESIRASRAARNGPAAPRANSVVSQLLTVRLAEATASRELLFRELVAVLQQESQARKIIIAQPNQEKRLRPFITHGFSPSESGEFVNRFEEARQKNEEKTFSRTKNTAVLALRPSSAVAAYLLIQPSSGAALNDGTPLQPLLRVVELGMDVVALRERERLVPAEQEMGPYLSNNVMPGFIHSSPAMTALVEEVYKIRSSDVTVLVTGESGTGKELVSRAIHTISNRKDKIFVPFNCTAVPKELAEGHLFGYRKGAFTGAVTDSPGMIRAADSGTLFLDEIGDLPLDVQPKLLRFLQEGEVQPIGEKRPIKVDVRVIAATNMPLEAKVADGSFREDLYYRLNVIRLRVPPLRERRSEIPPIVNHYINHYSARFGKHDITFTPQTVDLLMVCEWEGNVRQLCNEIQRIIARAVDNEVITPDHLSPELKRSAKPLAPIAENGGPRPIASYDSPFFPFKNISKGGTLEEAVIKLEMEMIKDALARNNWNISRVANELGLTRRGVYLKISRYGIEKAA